MAMKNYQYVIVGGGMTADAAVHGIRERDNSGNIAVLSGEKHPPYDRPPLSKKLWTGKPLDSIWRKTEQAKADLFLDTRAVSGDVAAKTITDSHGEVYRYEKLLMATGGVARRLPSAPDGVIYFRTLDDYQRLRALADRKSEFIVIGGGFIGSEIAAALSINGCKITMVFPDTGIGARIYPPKLSEFLNGYFRGKGVEVLTGEKVRALEKKGERFTVNTEGGKALSADAVVAGIGIEPEVGLAKSLGLKIDNGIVVDEQLRAAPPDIFAAGDIANFYSPALDMRRRVEHEDNANTMGAMAGRNMAGASEKYEHLPYFYSDLFDLGYEAVGDFGGGMDIVEDWKEPFRQGVVYYLKAGRVRGVLLWNTWGQVDAARRLIVSKDTFSAATLAGLIHE
ncbi:MAG: FAD-dependent oxidoreductase [Sulfuricaulis sp.]|uniref:NAD(P)/FAD-dependent oxidoreductase n=1 Tax=Sulfuricaulis sp. TaxID=2003553 RepID=UPI003C4582E2